MYTISFEKIQSLLKKEELLREILHDGIWHHRLTDANILETEFSSITYHSEKAQNGSLFFCKGMNFKEEYLDEVLRNGVSFFISEQFYIKEGAVGLIVTDVRKAMAVIAAEFYDYPQNKMKMIGVTGTKGKTTTVFFLQNILSHTTNGKTALVSSIHNTVDGKNYEEALLTTPESIELFQLMAQSVENGMTHFVMEVSSQAYKLDRVYGIQFDAGIFLNISTDHVGPLEHRDFEDYFYCKRQLLNHSDQVVLYHGTDHYTLLKELTLEQNKTLITYGDHHPDSQYYIEDDAGDSSRFYIKSSENDFLNIEGDYLIGIPGDFNKENALSATIVSALFGASRKDCLAGIENTRVPGRMSIFKLRNGSTAYVDYAHNYISLKRLLEFVKVEHPDGKVIALIGSPGGKGTSRRKDFGEVLSDHSDVAILTSDDPSFDDPVDIAKEIASHIKNDIDIQIIGDRIEAIEYALTLANPEDSIVIAGKGDHTHQIIDGKWEPYEGDDLLTERFIRDGKLL